MRPKYERLHEGRRSPLSSADSGYNAERLLMGGHEGGKTYKPSSQRSAHKVGGMVRENHACGGSTGGREDHGIGGSILGHLANFLPFKEGGKVSNKHLEMLHQNPHIMKMIKKRHQELSRMKGDMGQHHQREHHFLGSLIRGAKALYGMAKPMISKGIQNYGPKVAQKAAQMAAPHVSRGMEYLSNKLPSSVKKIGQAAMPAVRTGINMLEQKSPGFAKGMGMAREGAHAMGFEPKFKKGGRVAAGKRSRHAAGAVAKHRLDMY